LRATGFVDLSLLRTRRLEPVTEMIAPTERCAWRKKLLCGEVDDDNAYAMGGISGHAGLFASAKDLDALLCRLKECYHTGGPFLPQRIVREFWTRNEMVPDSTWCLGWDTPSPVGSSAGSHFSRHSVGHLGFTGCSVWLDLEQDRHVLLLSNRVHPAATTIRFAPSGRTSTIGSSQRYSETKGKGMGRKSKGKSQMAKCKSGNVAFGLLRPRISATTGVPPFCLQLLTFAFCLLPFPFSLPVQ